MTDINVCKRGQATKVGTRDEFETNVSTFGSRLIEQQVALAQMVAFAYDRYHRDGETWAINAIRAEVTLSKDAARRLSNCLARIPKATPEEGESVAKTALKFGNEFAADFFGEETKARSAKREAARARREEKAKAEKAKAEADLKAAREEAKAEAKAEATAEATGEVELPEFALLGEDGHIIPLTADEYTYLALMLAEKQQNTKDNAAAARKRDRDHAEAQRETSLAAVG